MKHFLVKVFLFSLPVMAVLCFLEISLRKIPNNYSYKKEQLLKGTENIQILVLGSSYSHYGVNPDYFTLDGFNFGNTYQTLDLDYEILKKYGDNLNQLKYIVIPASYGILHLQSVFKTQYKNNYIINYNIILPHFSYKISDFIELVNGTMFSNLKNIYQYYKNNTNLITISDKGYEILLNSTTIIDLEKAGIETALGHTADDSLLEYYKNIMEKIVEWCGERNIKLVLVTFPVYYTYRENLDEHQLNVTIDYMQYLTHREGIYYYNLLDDDRFTKDFFYDADHLNDLGATELSKILNDIIEEIN
jgi:hypothetical protein